MALGTFLLIFISVALSSGSQIILKSGMNQQRVQRTLADGDNVEIALSIATSPLVILGLACFALSAVVWLFVLSRTPLSSAYPFVAVGIIATVAFSALSFGETVSCVKMSGVGFIAAGILLVAIGS